MVDRERLRKKISLNKMKLELEQLTKIEIVDYMEAESDVIMKYRKFTSEMNKYSFPIIAKRKIESDKKMVEWFLKELPFIQNNTIWITPYAGGGVWWVRIKVNDCMETLEQIWSRGEICVVDEKNNLCFYIGIDEGDCEILTNKIN